MTSHTEAVAQRLPELVIPTSAEIVKVSLIHTGTYLDVPSKAFYKPIYEGAERLHASAYSFLLEHNSGQEVVFDLGIRKDWENLPPSKVEAVKKNGWTINTHQNVADVLQEHNIDVKGGDIDAVIWSHSHLDHAGDVTTFPKSTRLVVGRDFGQTFIPAYPHDPASTIWQHDFEGRDLQEIKFDEALRIGQFEAHDFFGDGSFYLLDTPGHLVSHMCGLARTTASPPTFVLLGGDIAHHAGQIRPSSFSPLPAAMSPPSIPQSKPSGSAQTSEDNNGNQARYTPFLEPCLGVYQDIEASKKSICGLQQFDGADDVLILLAHDTSIEGVIKTFPHALNDWKQQGYRETIRWSSIHKLKVVKTSDE